VRVVDEAEETGLASASMSFGGGVGGVDEAIALVRGEAGAIDSDGCVGGRRVGR
jgi:hypothetical protein